MLRNSGWAWRFKAQLFLLLFSMLVGIVCRFLGSNPLDLDNSFWENPQREPFLWLSSVAFLITVILSFRVWFLARAEVRRKSLAKGNESLSQEEKNTMRVNWLAYFVVFPGISLGNYFGNLIILSDLKIFIWLELVSILVAMVAAFVGVVIIANNLSERARAKKLERPIDY